MVTIVGDARDNTLVGTNYADRMFGFAGRDNISAGLGSDYLDGGAGRDTLAGANGNDTLLGGTGEDRLTGGAGNDLLIGGLGRDVMTGGAGADVFQFDDKDTGDVTSALGDVITDFGAGDTIDLTDVGVLFLDYWTSNPDRGGLSAWTAAGDTYLTWNTYGSQHDIKITGYHGSLDDLFDQVIWYDDDNPGRVNTTHTIAAGQTRVGTLEVPEDQDWFRIELKAGKVYDFHVEGHEDGFGTAVGPVVALYDSTGNFIDDDYGLGQFPYLAETSGTYYLAVQAYGTLRDQTYRLGVTSRVYSDDFGNDPETAGHINIGASRHGNIELHDDIDFLGANLKAGVTYEIDLTARAHASHPLDDPYLGVIDGNWNVLAEDDDSGTGNNAHLSFTPETDGTYYLAALDSFEGYGAYTIRIAEAEDALAA